MRNKTFKTPSKSSPKNSRKACLCPDGTYSRECCDGSLQAQGIGTIVRITNNLLQENGYDLLQENDYKIKL